MSWIIQTRYLYNENTRRYERKHVPARVHLSKWGGLFFFSIVLALGWYLCYTLVLGLENPKMAYLEQEQQMLKSGLEILGTRLEYTQQRLERIQRRDNHIYRTVFGMEQIPADVRNAGFGGTDRYAYLDHSGNKMFLNDIIRKYDVLSRKAYIQSLSFDDLEKASQQLALMAECVPTICPVDRRAKHFTYSSPFGYRTDPKNGNIRFHKGVDLAAAIGTEIHASGSGFVEEIGYGYDGYGRYVVVNHGFGYKTRYAHLRETRVHEGQKVVRGDIVGLMGTSGKSTGSHLHYEVMYMGRVVNPYNYINQDISYAAVRAVTEGER